MLSPRSDYNLPHNGACPDCSNPLEVAPATPPHHAMAVCIDCGDGLNCAFRGWLEPPPRLRRAWRRVRRRLQPAA